MSTHKTVYNKLFSKQELSAEKVELALVDDFKQEYTQAIKEMDKLTTDFANLETEKNKLVQKIKANINSFEPLIKKKSEIEQKAKELGVDIDSRIKGFNPSDDIKAMRNMISIIN